MILKLALFLAVITLSFVTFAEGIPQVERAKIEQTFDKWLKVHADDKGRFTFMDRRSNKLKGGYIANLHPKIVPYKGSSVFLRSDVLTDNSDRVSADILIELVEGEYRIVEVIVNDHENVEKMIGM